MPDQGRGKEVALEIRFSIRPKHRIEFLQTLDSLSSATAEMSRLCSHACYEQVGAEDVFLWRESWPTQADVEHRLESATVKTLLGAIGVLGELETVETVQSRGHSSSFEGNQAVYR